MELRSLAAAQDAGLLPWFRPALDRLASLPADPEARGFFRPDRPILIARAPGRLDVMGGIADYSGSRVLELPLARATWALLQRQDAPRCEVMTRREGRWDRAGMDTGALDAGPLGTPGALAARWAGRRGDRWPAYVLGVVREAIHRARAAGRPARGGIRLLLDSTVPEGRGVSSSAALEVACLSALAAGFGLALAPDQLAAACQAVENHVVGAPCGIMDQMTAVAGREDRLLRLRCQPGTVLGHEPVPAGYRFYGLDSGVRHAITGADYGTVRTAAFMGYRMIAEAAGLAAVETEGRVRVRDPLWHGYLANIPPGEFRARFEPLLPERVSGAEFLHRFGGTTDPATAVLPDRDYPVRRATGHPVFEQERVDRFAALLHELPGRPGAAAEMGELMLESHRSYGGCGLGDEATDLLVELVRAPGPARGLFGAKITGGGSGGTVAVLAARKADPLIRSIAAEYEARTGRPATVFDESGPGAEHTGVLEILPGEAPLSR